MIVQDVLDNGLTVVIEPCPALRTITLGLWIHQGVKHEVSSINGISHVIEHMAFHVDSKRDSCNLVESLRKHGAKMSAITLKDATNFHIVTRNECIREALDLLKLMVTDIDLPQSKVEKERRIILNEFNLYSRSARAIHEYGTMSLYGDVSIGQFVIGRKAFIEGFTADDLHQVFTNRYTPDNAVLVIVGNVDAVQMLGQIESCFSSWQGHAVASLPIPVDDTPSIIVHKDNSGQVLFALGLRTVPFGNQLESASKLFAYLIGVGLDSILIREIREKHQLVYQLDAHARHYQQGGIISVIGSTTHDNLPEVIRIMKDEFSNLLDGGLRLEDLETAKQRYLTDALVNNESSFERMNKIGRSVLLGGTYLVNNDAKGILAVSPDEMCYLLSTIWDPSLNLSFVGLGDFEEDKVFPLIS